ncbi:PAS-domain containing protein [Pseudorhodobacter sp.]|uniref:PAS-domain containing protein n=1 Tax=Pseudorhodobacter sp. TaxID=1934400 RepID=UPI0026490CAE|nr:PAS-domain containing protein [Pseudorhodobacter sp.]MDN5785817.1 PAS-domain containing protein [Pseudorhodobacter sp.]
MGRALLPDACKRGAMVWPGLISYLEPRFPGATNRLDTLSTDGILMLVSEDEGNSGPLLLRAELRGGITRISVQETDTTAAGSLDPLTRRAIKEELEQLRLIAAKAPLPIWRETLNGDVVWANATYLNLVTERLDDDDDLTWPLPQLFPARSDTTPRQKLAAIGDEKDRWFDLVISDNTAHRQVYALPADRTVKAEVGLHAFMQTLTKTFAHLSTGLAIFDHDRKLVLFNPALMDLTGLSPDLLTRRPSLATFFDALRENSMIPEPRDYKGWLNQITDIEKAAASGLYQETWSLPSGQTYRVIGRPHPNGALALSFEDISSEMLQTRRYRADLELGQAVIDGVDAAIAVFSAAGVLVMSNTAYSALWGHDPAAALGSAGAIATVCTHWRERTAPSTIWDRAEDFIAQLGPREAWQHDARLADGRALSCQFSPLAGGATMATFRQRPPREDDDERLTFTSTRKTA